jgi:hypothetical protein
MKRVLLGLVISAMITSGYALSNEKKERQFYKQGDWEFGFSTNIGASNEKTKGSETYSYDYDSTQYSYTYDNTHNGIYLNLGISTGYYIINGLSIEPEININVYSDNWSGSILGNLCYTFNLPQQNFYPYLKLGYGLSSEPTNSGGLFEKLDFKTINAGGGIKLMYSPGMEFRMEINYRNLSGSNEYSYSDQSYSSSSTSETKTSIISVSIGISILL